MPNQIFPVILSGGVGARLWPLSRKLRPKQFLGLLDQGLSLFRASIDNIRGEEYTPPLIVCNDDHRFLVAEELRNSRVRAKDIILETVARNTAPAITVAALRVFSLQPNGIMLVMPSDQVISDSENFTEAVEAAKALASDGMLVTFGVIPTRPETGYGYIKYGAPVEGGFRVSQFLEKPDEVIAKEFSESGKYYWNAGIFVFRADVYLAEVRKFHPDIIKAAEKALELGVSDLDFFRLDRSCFEQAPEVSIDVAIMEKTQKGVVIPLNSDWTDVGSWAGLSEIGVADCDGNTCVGESIIIDGHDNYIHTEKPFVAVLGIDGIALVATDDSVLAVPKARSQDVKKIVAEMKSQNREEIISHSLVYRPWGHYLNIDSGEGYLVKQIVVNPGGRLSLQYHNYRSEHWIVVEGVARVTNGKDVRDLHPNQSTYIPVGTRHRLENLTSDPLRLIEVQTGKLLSEDDIVREHDTYGRAEK
ncbi:MAG: mannose-1-phosphate guanylyltransferase/mannose-6-phosphate isomerase [Euryarchaeota archaeon]|nr:mannose-1-phosphate guanylyltransferase/mannose-6-phosphate isomerase [Euryarchaeota archaeon]